jgi:5'-nucleotidase
VRVLLSNDDGVHAPGLAALAAAFPGDEVWIVAPDREQSASSHSISLHRPLRVVEIGPRRYAVDGTPTDAVYMGMNLVLRGRRPDVVVSGVNNGPNLANDVLYSGTVAAAMEGALLGCHAVAVSLACPPPHEFDEAARFAAAVARHLVRAAPPAPVLLNVNVPRGPVRGYRFVRLGRRTYGNEVVENTDPRGRKYYWIGGEGAVNEDVPHSDCNCVFQDGLVSVTPLHLDWSHDVLLGEMKNWTVDGYRKEPSL